MPLTTPDLSLRYPDGPDPIDTQLDFANLANDTELRTQYRTLYGAQAGLAGWTVGLGEGSLAWVTDIADGVGAASPGLMSYTGGVWHPLITSNAGALTIQSRQDQSGNLNLRGSSVSLNALSSLSWTAPNTSMSPAGGLGLAQATSGAAGSVQTPNWEVTGAGIARLDRIQLAGAAQGAAGSIWSGTQVPTAGWKITFEGGCNFGKIALDGNDETALAPGAIGAGNWIMGANGALTMGAKLTTGGAVQFDGIGAAAAAANVRYSGTNLILEATSSAVFKREIRDLDGALAARVLRLRPITYKSKLRTPGENYNAVHLGLIAEEVHEQFPLVVDYKRRKKYDAAGQPILKELPAVDGVPQWENVYETDGLVPHNVQYERLVVPIIALLRQQQDEIEELRRMVAKCCDSDE